MNVSTWEKLNWLSDNSSVIDSSDSSTTPRFAKFTIVGDMTEGTSPRRMVFQGDRMYLASSYLGDSDSESPRPCRPRRSASLPELSQARKRTLMRQNAFTDSASTASTESD